MGRMILTLVRHGESTDNLKSLWAGWQDAPLSNHGMNQARRVGAALASTPLTAIYTSDLKRALWTAQQISKQNKTVPPPPLTVSEVLREQHFGQGEGKPWSSAAWQRESGRDFSFPDGESLHDVAARAERAIDEYIMPHLLEAQSTPDDDVHVVVTAHGIFLAELQLALLRRQPGGVAHFTRVPLENTGWHRLHLSLVSPSSSTAASTPPASRPTTPLVSEPASRPHTPDAGEIQETLVEGGINSDKRVHEDISHRDEQPRLRVKFVKVAETAHLKGLVRQKGGIGSAGFDPKQRDLKALLAGGGGD